METLSNQERRVKGERQVAPASSRPAFLQGCTRRQDARRYPFRSPAAGGDRLGRSAKDAVAQPARPFVGVRHFGDLEEFFMQFTEMDFDGLFLLRASYAQTQNVAGFLLPRPALRAARHVRVVPTHNFVANLQATFCGGAIRVNRGDGPWAPGFP